MITSSTQLTQDLCDNNELTQITTWLVTDNSIINHNSDTSTISTTKHSLNHILNYLRNYSNLLAFHVVASVDGTTHGVAGRASASTKIVNMSAVTFVIFLWACHEVLQVSSW